MQIRFQPRGATRKTQGLRKPSKKRSFPVCSNGPSRADLGADSPITAMVTAVRRKFPELTPTQQPRLCGLPLHFWRHRSGAACFRVPVAAPLSRFRTWPWLSYFTLGVAGCFTVTSGWCSDVVWAQLSDGRAMFRAEKRQHTGSTGPW